jgi:hypothetical protein
VTRDRRDALLLCLAASVVFLGCCAFVARTPIDEQATDLPLYERYGDLTVAGKLPYRDFRIEYPSGVLPLFALPSLGYSGRVTPAGVFEPARRSYRRRFIALELACAVATLAALAWTLSLLGASLRRRALTLGAFALAPLLLGPSLVLNHFDYWPAALTAWAIACALARRRGWAAVLLGAAIAVKVYPVVVVPLLAMDAWRAGGAPAARRCVALCLGAALALVVPFAALAPHGVWWSFARQAGRPLQVESLGSTALLVAHSVTPLHVEIVTSAGSQNLQSSLSGAVAVATVLLELAALVWAWLHYWRGSGDAEELVRWSAASIVAFVAFGKVLSPQFLIWLVACVLLVRGRRGLVAGALLAGALGLTATWFPLLYFDWVRRIELHGDISLLVFERDLLLVAVFGVLAWTRRSGWLTPNLVEEAVAS